MATRRVLTTGLAVLAADQISKIAVVHLMDLKTLLAIDVWPPYLNFRMAWNYGINFGLFSNSADLMRWVLVAVALAISAWVILWLHRDNQGRMAQISGGLLVGGAIGNVIDRIAYGAVADFLNMSCCGFSNPYSFNIADIAIFAGAIGLIVFTSSQKPADAPPENR
ncbi:MAG: signal peptidase II [Rhodobacteraceae bacterium]|nr:signal peptidase II [Paracoccaceae bacterium]